MASMSYCRFQNAAEDMNEYIDYLDDDIDPHTQSAEYGARQRFVKMCEYVARNYGGEEP